LPLESPVFWIIPVALQGAIMGSFLNVVIFRLPLGMSVWRPRWSFCPHCRSRIPPLCNVPILSWLWLRGKCRDCAFTISMTYPLVEAMTMLVFVMIWDALFIASVVPDTGRLADFWPLGIAYLGLFAGLLASSAMDIESYTVHIEPSIAAMILGVLAHGIVGLPDAVSLGQVRHALAQPPPALALASAAGGVGWLLTVLLIRSLRKPAPKGWDAPAAGQEQEHESFEVDEAAGPAKLHITSERAARFRPVPVLALCALIFLMIAWQILEPGSGAGGGPSSGSRRGMLASAVLMFTLVLASMVPREVDRVIFDEIERERSQARSMAVREMGGLLPAIGLAAIVLLVLRHAGRIDSSWEQLLTPVFGSDGVTQRVAATVSAIGSLVLAAGLGWAVRIGGTLVFGKEAFGTGDIYLMAAIGAVGGFWMVVVGFFLSALLALVGVAATLIRKTSRAVPFGPWLALGAYVALWAEGPILAYFRPAGRLLWSFIAGSTPESAGSM